MEEKSCQLPATSALEIVQSFSTIEMAGKTDRAATGAAVFHEL
jgi:hypothetical protein